MQVRRLNTYTTTPAVWTPDELSLAKTCSIATFASPSAAKTLAQNAGCEAVAVTIGPTTEKAARKLGFRRVFSPAEGSKGLEWRLLGKVDRLSSKESERMTVTKSFVSTLNSSSSDLVKQVTVLATQSKDHSVTLCTGVEQILNRGRATYDTLKGSIHSALSSLTNDAEAARDVMTTSCGSLKTEPRSTYCMSSLAKKHSELASAAVATCALLLDCGTAFTSSINQVNDIKMELTFKLDTYKKASELTMCDANVAL
eukprot:gene31083-38415_t